MRERMAGTDILRYTFDVSSPYVLAVLFRLLQQHPKLKLVRSKNKLVDRDLPAEIRTNVLLNAAITGASGTVHVIEVQLTFAPFLGFTPAAVLHDLECDTLKCGRTPPISWHL